MCIRDRSRSCWRYWGYPTQGRGCLPASGLWISFSPRTPCPAEVCPLPASTLSVLPLVVKPAAQGSALGISVVGEARDLPRAMVSALSFDRKVMLEEFISGRELAVSIVGTQDPRVLPIVEAVPKSGHDFYDFESRYTPGETEFNVPASLESAVAEEVERISLETYRALGCSGFGRVDIILDAADRPWILELNTIPGLTETSLMPAAAEAAGLPFEDLVETVVATAFEPKAE